ncbi:NAD(P)/FAD-dependent oxidoreductase [Vulcanisaeta souniana]|uniref:Glycerol-3-phosphate dehydrogenase n=1 Tax=Vulcanisaeta souniana JCM 11219 TaxID=1293586 RepID=A0A830EIU9_9CREN|nr:FAD-dependent oxidoreductase [Vulcanisaeta souniana]BDR92455.1 glycerol-3-phosphate dehydrogenase [Vulcanisaeta souniana JCM 11219]GGI75674.1 glycerol-3-phosphate dehydrogenase [Vulcanisaeta souniana JCM 11219]
MNYDVAVMGSGVVGLFIAYELAHYRVRVIVIDREAEPGFGVSRGHAGVIHVVQPPFNSLRSRLAVEGNRLYDDVARRLHVKVRRLSTLLVARNPGQLIALPAVWLILNRVYGRRGFRVRILGPRGLRRLEPNVNGLGAIEVEGYGVINSFELVSQLYNFCRLNGVDFALGTEVKDAKVLGDGAIIITSSGEYRARFVINAAGLYSADIARLFGDEYRLEFGKGVMLVFWGEQTKSIVTPLQLIPNPKTKGGAIIPTAFGTTIWGPSLSIGSRDDRSVNEGDIDVLYRKFSGLLRDRKFTPIRAYAGVRPIPEGDDFIITHSKVSKRIVHVIGIESPGLTAAPAIARRVIDMLRNAGAELIPKDDVREVEPMVMMKNVIGSGGAIKGDQGEVICPCMGVTRTDIREAIRHGARTLDGIAFRTGLGMGICQGMCLGRAIKVISEELGIDPRELTKSGGNSWLVTR